MRSLLENEVAVVSGGKHSTLSADYAAKMSIFFSPGVSRAEHSQYAEEKYDLRLGYSLMPNA
ncbi:hypothetical protein ACUHMQ_19480 [Chitinimonas sp. PSY-7]|uniref:hypothetical protein n=1 Tax=Chitinimonas sp. PSY-7 TaxID=3459088 RepID=UPI0040401483